MTANPPTGSRRNLRALVYEAIPPSASPTDTLCQPLHRHVLEKSQGDVIELTTQKVQEQFGDTPHVVLVLRDGDLDPETDGDVYRLLQQTDGGVVVFGVTYTEHAATQPHAPNHGEGRHDVNSNESCPECGSTDAFEVRRADTPNPQGRTQTLLECRECGAVWDSYA